MIIINLYGSLLIYYDIIDNYPNNDHAIIEQVFIFLTEAN